MISISPKSQSALDELLKLPLDQRVAVAQALWASIDAAALAPQIEDDDAFFAELMRRDAEMEAGDVTPMTHQEIMAAVRRDLECDSPTTRKPAES